MTAPSTRFASSRGAALLLLALGLAAALVWLGTRSGDGAPDGAVPAADRGDAGPPAARGVPAPPESASGGRAATEAPPAGAARLLVCLAAEDRRPLAGVGLYAGELLVAGPSAADGRLVVPAAPGPVLTAWCAGRAPALVRCDAPPARVLLEAARAALEVRMVGLRPQDRVVRTQLEPHLRRAAASGPWTPTLEPRALEVVEARGLPAGRYDVWLWIDRAPGGVGVWARRGVEVAPGAAVQISIDLDADRVPEPPD